MTALYLYDDLRARAFAPFALTRPVSELCAGAELIRRRWEVALGVRAAGFVGAPHLTDFEELDAPAAARGIIPAGSVVANSRCVVALAPAAAPPAAGQGWTCAARTAAVRLPRDLAVEELLDGGLPLERLSEARAPTIDVAGRWADEPWDLLRDLAPQLAEDIVQLGPRLRTTRPPDATVLGGHPVYVEDGATVEPHVVLDAAAGPILVRRGATVQAFTRLVGPCAVGERAIVTTDRVAGSSIGEMSRVHGELHASIVLGHANKAHDGFVGNSYLGRWVNLGAGTITSNLKNTYGSVSLWTPEGERNTGLQFLGSLVGDHAKTGIGTRLTTGTVIGAGANLFGAAMPPKYVPPFAWGDGAPYGTYDAARFLAVAERVMARRQVTLGERARRQLARAHALATAGRRTADEP